MKPSFYILVAALWGCGNDNIDGDGNNGTGDGTGTDGSSTTFDGRATLSPSVTDGSAWDVSVTGPEDTVTGSTGDDLTVSTDEDGETFTVQYGDPAVIGCDGQRLSSDGEQMVLPVEIVLADGDSIPVTANPFDYYEWEGALQCTAWRDEGSEVDYDPEDYTNEDEQVTCINSKGELEIGANELSLVSGEPVLDGEIPVTNLSVDDNGLSLTADRDGDIVYIDCVVVD